MTRRHFGLSLPKRLEKPFPLAESMELKLANEEEKAKEDEDEEEEEEKGVELWEEGVVRE